MGCRRVVFGCLGVLVAWSAAGPAPGQTAPAVLPWGPGEPTATFGPAPVALDEVPPAARARVRAVIEQPTLASHGPAESFNCQPSLYAWLLDHPDQAVRLWRRLGARCLDIDDHGGGHFGYRDAQGSDVRWETVVSTPGQRVWYAEGKVRPGLLLPSVTIRAVVVIRYSEGRDRDGHPAVRHQAHMVLHADSHAVALATRLFGASAPHVAEQYVSQLEMFYGALAWYLDRHPSQAEALLADLHQPGVPGTAPGRAGP